jgi:hypothetical protein
VRVLLENGLNAEDIHKEIFRVYGGECLFCKAVHNWVENRGKHFADDEEFGTEVRKQAAVTTVEGLLCCGFLLTSKAMGQFYQCWWRICREINIFFSGFECFMFYIHL